MNRRSLVIIIAILAAVLILGLAALLVLDSREPEPTAPTQTQTPTTEPATQPTESTDAPTDAPTEPPTTAPTEPPDEVFTLTFTGDCTLGTEYGSMDYSGSFVKLVGDNYQYPFENVVHLFENDDCTFINLESVLADGGTPAVKRFRFRGPTSYVNILTQNSVEVANLANNHTYDFGEEGYATTRSTLKNAGIFFAGANECTLITTDSGLKIGMYSVNFFLDEADFKKDVAWMKEQGAEVIVVSLHCGDEGHYRPKQKQYDYARFFIDNGANIVWGHHPHALQPIEEYNGGIIYYSLGNFSFGGNHNPSDKDSVVLQQQIIRSPEGEIRLGELTVIPCRVSSVKNYNDFRPTPLEEGSEEYLRVLSKLDGTFQGPDVDPPYKNDPLPTEPTEPPTDPTDPTEEPTDPTEEPTDPTEESTDPTEESTESS